MVLDPEILKHGSSTCYHTVDWFSCFLLNELADKWQTIHHRSQYIYTVQYAESIRI